MFRGFSKKLNFHGFPNQNAGSGGRVTAYGYPLCSFWMNAEAGLNAVSNLDPVSIWVDQAGQIPFIQNTASLQPRLVKNVASFGGRDLVDFHTAGRGVQASTNVAAGTAGKTLAVVYEYTSVTTQARIFGDNEFANARSTGYGFTHGHVNNTTFRDWVGYGSGANVLYGFMGAPVYANTPRILIFTRGVMILNGVQVTLNITGSPMVSGPISWIGSPLTTFNGIFRLGEILLYDREFSLSECIDLSNTLNLKYALY